MNNDSLIGALRRKKLKSDDMHGLMNGEWKDKARELDDDGLAPILNDEKAEDAIDESVPSGEADVAPKKSAKEALGFEPLEATKKKDDDDDEMEADHSGDLDKSKEEVLAAMTDEGMQQRLEDGKEVKNSLWSTVQKNILKKKKKGSK